MGFDSSWRNDIIAAIAKGLRNKPSGKSKFHNSLEPRISDRIIRKEGWDSEFARLCYVTYLFTLRLPSEAVPLVRATTDDRLLTSECSTSTNLFGLREFQGEQRLVIKLAHRKNTRNAFIATRPCFCGQNALLPKHNFPIHRFWQAVLGHTHPGMPLFPLFQGENFPRALRAVLKKLHTPESDRYSSHCFRRGAATAILNSGATLSEIMRTGGWASSSFKVYLDLQRSEEPAMKDVLAGASPISACPSDISETSSITSSRNDKRLD